MRKSLDPTKQCFTDIKINTSGGEHAGESISHITLCWAHTAVPTAKSRRVSASLGREGWGAGAALASWKEKERQMSSLEGELFDYTQRGEPEETCARNACSETGC